MEKGATQLELFSQSSDTQFSRGEGVNPVVAFLRNFEKTILFMIGVIAAGVVCFGLGVEQGKRMTVVPKRQAALPAAPKVVPVAAAAPVVSIPVKAPEKTAPKFLEQQGYVIQLASYKNKSLADQEALALKKNGFTPVLYPKGSFTVLCVGSIANKEIAFSMLPELRKHYKDCYIRRL
jgi:hypothetical protein